MSANLFHNSFFKDRNGHFKFPILTQKGFWWVLAIKIAASCIFASDYLRLLFGPFIDHFLSGESDPYTWFNQQGRGDEFPYPPVMLWLVSAGRLLTGWIDGFQTQTFTAWEALGIRLPLLAADFVIFMVLLRWFSTRQHWVFWVYWCSPVVFYINYMHGQLDILPMALLFVSLHALFRERWWFSGLFMGLALAAKSHMILAVPFYFWYVNRNFQRQYFSYIKVLGTGFLVWALAHIPYVGNRDFIEMVYQNSVQSKVLDLYYQFNAELKIYFIPAIYVVLVTWYFSLRFVNKDQLILFLGFTFMALTLMIAPMQGWYMWVMPFMGYFVIKHGSRIESYLFGGIQAMYFLYFTIIPSSDIGKWFTGGMNVHEWFIFHGIPTEIPTHLIFTLLQTALLAFIWLVYKNGIRQNIQTKFLSQPYLLGIGGDSGTGKSTLSQSLQLLFGQQKCEIIRGDDMHKWERGAEEWKEKTHLNPSANYLHQHVQQARALKNGRGVARRHYDHQTGTFTLPQFIKPKKLIVFEGLHSFYLQNQAEIYDLKIFMMPHEALRRAWKIQRDTAKRGYTAEKVKEQLDLRQPDSEKYILGQADKADILFRFYPLDSTVIEDLEAEPNIGLQIRVSDMVDLEYLLEELSKQKGIKVSEEYENGHRWIHLEGAIEAEEIAMIGIETIPEMEEVGVYEPYWNNGYTGLMQLFTAYVIFKKLHHASH